MGRTPWAVRVWLGALVLLVLALRLFHLGAPFHQVVCQTVDPPVAHPRDAGLWTDEAFTLVTAEAPVPVLLDVIGKVDVSPPGYYLFLHAWTSVFGPSEFAARLPAALASWLSVLLLAMLMRRLDPSVHPAWVLALGGAAAFSVFYGQEVRMYPVIASLGLLATLVFVQASTARGWILYGVLVAAMIWLHYLSVLIAVAHGVEAAIERRQFKAWLAAFVGGCATLAPWAPQLYHQMTGVTGLGGLVFAPLDLWRVFGRYGVGETSPCPVLWAGLAFIVFGAAAALQSPRRRLLLLCLFLPSAAMAAVSILLHKGIFEAKYAMTSATLLWGVLAGPVSKHRGLAVGAILLIGLNLWADYRHALILEFHTEEMQPIADYIQQQERSDDVILIESRGAFWPFVHYYHGVHDATPVTAGDVPDRLQAAVAHHPRIFLVEAAPAIADPSGQVEGWLRGHYPIQQALESTAMIPVRLLVFGANP